MKVSNPSEAVITMWRIISATDRTWGERSVCTWLQLRFNIKYSDWSTQLPHRTLQSSCGWSLRSACSWTSRSSRCLVTEQQGKDLNRIQIPADFPREHRTTTSVASLTFAPWTLDEKIDEVQQCQVSVLFVRLDPLVHHRLYTHTHTQWHF